MSWNQRKNGLFRFLGWPIHKLSCNTPHRRSTTVFFRNLPPFLTPIFLQSCNEERGFSVFGLSLGNGRIFKLKPFTKTKSTIFTKPEQIELPAHIQFRKQIVENGKIPFLDCLAVTDYLAKYRTTCHAWLPFTH